MNWHDILVPHLKEFEGLRLEAYRDSAGVLTIGFGHTGGVRPGERITNARAEELLREDIREHAEPIDELVDVPLSEHERAALASFVFNLGARAFATSTLLRKLNAGDRAGAADEFLRWVHAGGRKLRGLERRREAERAMFLTPDAEVPAPEAVRALLPRMSNDEIAEAIKFLAYHLNSRRA